ncbi:MAG: MFS transporter [Chloroflexi bacterium]|nr:MFS transporter [Chloroflexota bacterium]
MSARGDLDACAVTREGTVYPASMQPRASESPLAGPELERPPAGASPATPVAAPPDLEPAGALGALTVPRYRRYWLGSLATVAAIQLAALGEGWLIVDELGGSPRVLGTLGAATAAPTILVNLLGGVLADRVNRRVVMAVTSLCSAALLLALTILDVTNTVEIWHVIVVAALMGVIFGIDSPARNAFFPDLIERRFIQSAVALNAIMWQGTRIVAPMVGGLLVSLAGTQVVFALGAVGFALMLPVLLTLRVAETRPERGRDVLADLVGGVRFIAAHRLFTLLILLSYSHMFFGLQYFQLMPLVAKAFDRGASGFGTLLTMIGVGAVTGTAITLRLQRFRHQGRLLLGALFAAELLICAFALAPRYELALVLLLLASICNAVFLIVSMTALQLRVPDAVRGRVMGIHSITFSMAMLGGLLGGEVAELSSVRVALLSGAALMAAVVAVVTLTERELRALRNDASALA